MDGISNGARTLHRRGSFGMSASPIQDVSPGLSMIVHETLATVFSPPRLRKVLAEACDVAGLRAIPEAPVSLQVFVEGPLFTTLARRLGVSVALELNRQIREAVEPGIAVDEGPISAVHKGRDQLTAPPPARRVLAVTQASLVVFLLQDQLGDSVEVLPIGDARHLEDRLRRFGGQPLLVVVDRRHPCVGPEVARLLRRLLEPIGCVIWWGAEADEQLLVEAELTGGPTFVPTSDSLQLADLGGVCLSAIA